MPVLGPNSNATGRTGNSNASNANSTNTAVIESLYNFLTEFSDGGAFLYRDRLRANLLKKEWTLEVEMGHLIGWNEELAARCRTEPGEVVPLVSQISHQFKYIGPAFGVRLKLGRARSTR